MTTDDVLGSLKRGGGTALHASFDKSAVEAIRALLATQAQRPTWESAFRRLRPSGRGRTLLQAFERCVLIRVERPARYAAVLFGRQGTYRKFQTCCFFFEADPPQFAYQASPVLRDWLRGIFVMIFVAALHFSLPVFWFDRRLSASHVAILPIR